MRFRFIHVSATHVAIFRVVETIIPLNFQEFLTSGNFTINLIVIPLLKKVFGILLLPDITFCAI
jgi:hypothetical protein